MSQPLSAREETFLDGVRRVATDVAAIHADEVDRDARFPSEAVAALREIAAFSAAVPSELGGAAISTTAIAAACFELGRSCAATAMIFAMHQIQVGTLLRHLSPGSWFEQYLRALCREQRLIASATSEVGVGGDMTRSIAAITPTAASGFRLDKRATTISYGAWADDLLTSARRTPDAEPGDQALVLHSMTQSTLEADGDWDTLGMRGTCSPPFTLSAEFGEEQIVTAPFSELMAETIVPMSHIFWSHVWLGIATDAFERGRRFLRSVHGNATAARAVGEQLAQVMPQLQALRSEVFGAVAEFETADRQSLHLMNTVLRFNNLKLEVSQRAPWICEEVLATIGIVGYANQSAYSVGRHLRDSLSARVMISNTRMTAIDGRLLMLAKGI